MVSMLSEKPIIMPSTPSLSRFPNFAFETVPVFVWLKMALSSFQGRSSSATSFLFPPLCTRWSMSAGSLSRSSTLYICRLWWLSCPPIRQYKTCGNVQCKHPFSRVYPDYPENLQVVFCPNSVILNLLCVWAVFQATNRQMIINEHCLLICLPWRFAHVLCCRIKISVLLNLLCV